MTDLPGWASPLAQGFTHDILEMLRQAQDLLWAIHELPHDPALAMVTAQRLTADYFRVHPREAKPGETVIVAPAPVSDPPTADYRVCAICYHAFRHGGDDGVICQVCTGRGVPLADPTETER